MLVVLGFAVLSGVMLANLHRVTEDSVDELSHRYSQLVARNIANSASVRALSQMWQDPTWRTGYSLESCFGGTYHTDVVTSSADPSLRANQYRLETEARYDRDSARVEVLLEKPSFARFVWFTEDEAGNHWITGDVVGGPVHTNGYFTMEGTPIFLDDVSSAEVAPPPATDPWAGGGTPDFRGDTEFGRPPIHLPTNLSTLYALAASGGRTFTQDVWIQLGPTAPSFKYVLTDPGRPIIRTDQGLPYYKQYFGTNPTTPGVTTVTYASFNGVIAATGGHDIHIWGRLDGQLTLVASRNIYVEDDVLYTAPPPMSDDLLGLVAENDVIVAWSDAPLPASADPNNQDCTIQASILALHSFAAQSYWLPLAQAPPPDPTRGTLTVVGGVVQNVRGSVYQTHPGKAASGYNQIYTYDPRLRTTLPPAYPLYDDNLILSWQE